MQIVYVRNWCQIVVLHYLNAINTKGAFYLCVRQFLFVITFGLIDQLYKDLTFEVLNNGQPSFQYVSIGLTDPILAISSPQLAWHPKQNFGLFRTIIVAETLTGLKTLSGTSSPSIITVSVCILKCYADILSLLYQLLAIWQFYKITFLVYWNVLTLHHFLTEWHYFSGTQL